MIHESLIFGLALAGNTCTEQVVTRFRHFVSHKRNLNKIRFSASLSKSKSVAFSLFVIHMYKLCHLFYRSTSMSMRSRSK